MTDASTLDPRLAAEIARTVQAAYDRAVAAKWDAGARAALWEATVEAVGAYLVHGPDDPHAVRYHQLLLDMTADVTAEHIMTWPPNVQRAARLAATHVLRRPSRPHHRPRAQALLKRLDLVQSQLLQARERLLLAVARLRQALGQERTTGSLARRWPEAQAETGLMVLRRITEAVRSMPMPDPGDPAHETAIARMRELQGLVESGAVLDAARHAAVFEALQRLLAPDRPDLPIAPALDALEAVRLQANPAVRQGRQALAAMVFELALGDYAPAEIPALTRHLADLAHVARNLGDIPAAQLPPILFRLRQRLADPTSETIEARIDEALAVLDRLGARREAALARLARAEAAIMHPDDQRQEVMAARARLRELDQLIDAVHLARLARLGPAEAAGVGRAFARLEELATAPQQDAEAFARTLQDVTLLLERPRLSTSRVWQAGRDAAAQLAAQRKALEEQMRGLTLDRHLDEAAREARARALGRRIAALERAGIVLGSMPLERVGGAAEAEALAAIAALSQAARVAAAGGEPAAVKAALDRLVAAVDR